MIIIGLSGLPGAGKSTIAAELFREYDKYYPSKVMHKELSHVLLDNAIDEMFDPFSAVNTFDFKEASNHEKYGYIARQFLQELGHKLKADDPLILVNKIRDLVDECLEHKVIQVLIFSGVRGQPEVEAIQSYEKGRVIHLISPWRSADTKIDNHQVEANNLNDVYEIQNLEGKEKLTCAAIMSYMRDFTGEGPL